MAVPDRPRRLHVLKKLLRHAQDGTLVKVATTKIRHTVLGNRGRGDTYYGDEAAGYEAQREGKAYWDDQQRIAEGLIGELPDSLKVLDVPFGTGRFARTYSEKNFDVIGVEASQAMIDAAHAARGDLLGGWDLRVGDALELPLQDNSVDITVCFRFLSEIISSSDAKVVLAELQRVTKDRALLDLGYREEDAPAVRPPRDRDRFGVSLTEREVRELLASYGFSTERVVKTYASGDGFRGVFVCRKITPAPSR